MFNVTRSETTPDSLAGKTWRGADVAQALRIDFYDKCYLCETKDPLSFNIEHFDAHQGNEAKKYDWENLYFACARCNNFKGTVSDILDCTDPKTDVLKLIKHAPPTTPFSTRIIIEAQGEDPKTKATAMLLQRIFNEESTGNRQVALTYLRKSIFKRYAKLVSHINVYIDDDSLPQEQHLALDHIKNLMNKKQEFSAFLRWAVLEAPDLLALVGDAID